MIEWTAKDSSDALSQGWDVFDCEGSMNGRWQICMLDEDEDSKFDTDPEVWMWMKDHPTPLTEKAIQFVRENNNLEYNSIIKYITKK